MTDQTPQPPIIVMSAPGPAGATVAAALGQNPGAFDVPLLNLELEENAYDTFFEMTGLRGMQIHGLLRSLGLLLGGEQSMLSIDMARRWLLGRLHLSNVAIANWYLNQVAPLRLVVPVEAGIFDTAAHRRLARMYRDADVIMVQQNPEGMATPMTTTEEVMSLLLGTFNEAEDGVRTPDSNKLKRLAIESMQETADAMPDCRVHTVQYEDLLQDPAKTLKSLARRLRLSYGKAAVDAMCHPENSPFFGTGPYGANMPPQIQPLIALPSEHKENKSAA